MSHDTQVTEPATATTTDDQLPVDIRNRIIMHGETAPYHRRLQQEHGIEYADLQTWSDLRETFDHVDDETLRALDPQELIPEHYSRDELVLSRSSGTTGTVKEVYWHKKDIKKNIEATSPVLGTADIPKGVHWIGTTTPNPFLKEFLRGVADYFEGTIELIEVDPKPVKKALQSNDESEIKETLTPIAEKIVEEFDRRDIRVYEDIAPLMRFVGPRLSNNQREKIDALLIGGVGTTKNLVKDLTQSVFLNASLTGWYGEFMNGINGMHSPKTLGYIPQDPSVKLEVRDTHNLKERVSVNETGEIVSHAIRRGFFVPNRRIGDGARPIRIDGIDGVTDIHRLDS